MAISTYRIRVDTPSGRKSYMLMARSGKNVADNLTTLCRPCHDAEHAAR